MDVASKNRRALGHSHVERTSLLMQMSEAVTRQGMVLLSGPYGYGKSSLLADFGAFWHSEHSSKPSCPVLELSHGAFQKFVLTYREARRANHPVLEALRRACRSYDASRWAGGSRGRRVLSTVRLFEQLPDAWGALPRVIRPDDATTLYLFIHMAHLIGLERISQTGESAGEQIALSDSLLLMDDVPLLEAGCGCPALYEALRWWMEHGVRCACTASGNARSFMAAFPDAICIPARDLLVSEGEYDLWVHDLCLHRSGSSLQTAHGVPLLLDAARLVRGDEALEDTEVFQTRASRILMQCLSDALPREERSVRDALVLFGSGTLEDIESVCGESGERAVLRLADAYPHLGISAAGSTFRCVAVKMRGAQGLFYRIVEEGRGLAARVVRRLLETGRSERAGEIARMLPATELVAVMADYPLVFADLGLGELMARGLRSVVRRDEGGAVASSKLERLDKARVAIFGGDRLLPRACRTGGEAKAEEDCILDDFDVCRMVRRVWDRVGGGEGAGGARPSRGRGEMGRARRKALALEDSCELLARGAVHGDMPSRLRVRGAILEGAHALGGLAERALLHHIALCDMLLGEFGDAIVVLTPHVCGAREGAGPGGISDDILTADRALAQILAERPEALLGQGASNAGDAREALSGARARMEQRSAAAFIPLALLVEAIALVADGREGQAWGALERCLAMFGTRGSALGQMGSAICLALCCLVQGRCGQAQAFVSLARQLARRLEARRMRELCDLLGTLAGLAEDSPRDQDARLLTVTLLENALRPRVSAPLMVEHAVLEAICGDAQEARDIFEGIARTSRPHVMRLAWLAARCAGAKREAIASLLPAGLSRGLATGSPAVAETATVGGAGVSFASHGDGAPLVVRLFGGMRVMRNGHCIGDEEWGRQKARWLLAHLALFPERALTRERIARMLWPGMGYETSRQGLYAALTTLRGALGQKHGGPAFILTVGDAVRLNLELIDVDVLAFERAARSVLARRDAMPAHDALEACSHIEELYGAGLDLTVDCLGEEGRLRSSALAQLYVDCMAYASGVAYKAGNAQLALWFARAGKRADPYREDVGLATMRALEALSCRGAAADEYLRLAEHLRGEQGIEPSEELNSAYRRIVGKNGREVFASHDKDEVAAVEPSDALVPWA